MNRSPSNFTVKQTHKQIAEYVWDICFIHRQEQHTETNKQTHTLVANTQTNCTNCFSTSVWSQNQTFDWQKERVVMTNSKTSASSCIVFRFHAFCLVLIGSGFTHTWLSGSTPRDHVRFIDTHVNNKTDSIEPWIYNCDMFIKRFTCF